ncbi:hypothetical protein [Filimonas lacunae]|nr:hypothetical protein [Filimonas lacunae]
MRKLSFILLAGLFLLSVSYKTRLGTGKKVSVYAVESLGRQNHESPYVQVVPTDSLFVCNNWIMEKVVSVKQVITEKNSEVTEIFKGYNMIDLQRQRFRFLESLPKTTDSMAVSWFPLTSKREGITLDHPLYNNEALHEKDTLIEGFKRKLIRYQNVRDNNITIVLGDPINDGVYFNNLERKFKRRIQWMSAVGSNGSESLTKISYSVLSEKRNPIWAFFQSFKCSN